MGRNLLAVVLVLSLINAGLVAVGIYAAMSASGLLHGSEIGMLVRDGVIDVDQVNRRLRKDGRDYTVTVSEIGSVTNAWTLDRDYFLPSRYQSAIQVAGMSVLLSLSQAALVTMSFVWLRRGGEQIQG